MGGYCQDTKIIAFLYTNNEQSEREQQIQFN